MKKNKEMIMMLILAIVFLFIFNGLTGISFTMAIAMIVLAFALAIGYVQFLRKKDEMQQYIIQNALATAFIAQMAGYLMVTIIEWIRDVNAHYQSWTLLLSGLILFVVCLFLTRSRYRVG